MRPWNIAHRGGAALKPENTPAEKPSFAGRKKQGRPFRHNKTKHKKKFSGTAPKAV